MTSLMAPLLFILTGTQLVTQDEAFSRFTHPGLDVADDVTAV